MCAQLAVTLSIWVKYTKLECKYGFMVRNWYSFFYAQIWCFDIIVTKYGIDWSDVEMDVTVTNDFDFFLTRLHQIETSCFFKKYASDLTFYFFFSLIVLLTHISLSTMFRNQESKKTICVIFLCPLFDCACVFKCVLGVCQYVVFFDASNIHICTIHIYTILLKTFFIFKFLDFCQQHIISVHFCIDFRSAHNLNTFYFAIDFRHEISNSVWSWSGTVDGLRLNRFRKNSICWEEKKELNHSMNYTNQMTETVTTNTMFNAIWIIRKSAFKIDISICYFFS